MHHRRIAMATHLLLLLAIAHAAPAAATASPLAWSQPQMIDGRPPFGSGGSLSGVSCPSTSLCVTTGLRSESSGARPMLRSCERGSIPEAWSCLELMSAPG